MPSGASRCAIAARTGALRAPMPPVNTSVSSPPSTVTNAGDVLGDARTNACDRCAAAGRPRPTARAASSRRRSRRRCRASRSRARGPRRRSGVALQAEQVEHHTGIEVARSGGHDEPAARREAHRRVDGRPVAQRDEARRRCRGARSPSAGRAGRRAADDVLVGQAVEPVPPDALRPRSGPGSGRRCADFGQPAVERGVEARDLRHAGESRRSCSMPAIAAGWCSGASGTSARAASITSSSMSAGPKNSAPPCTTR